MCGYCIPTARLPTHCSLAICAQQSCVAAPVAASWASHIAMPMPLQHNRLAHCLRQLVPEATGQLPVWFEPKPASTANLCRTSIREGPSRSPRITMSAVVLSLRAVCPCDAARSAQSCQARPSVAALPVLHKPCQPCSRPSSMPRAATTDAPAKAPEESLTVQQGSGPELSPEECTAIYRDMVLGREFEEMCAQMYYRGKMFGFVHLYSGQEAVSTGVIGALRKDDYVCSTYRDHVHALSKKVPSREIMAELFGKKTGICRGQGGSMHMFSKEHGLVRMLPLLVLLLMVLLVVTPISQMRIRCCIAYWKVAAYFVWSRRQLTRLPTVQLGGFAFIGEGIPIGLGAAYKIKYMKVSPRLLATRPALPSCLPPGHDGAVTGLMSRPPGCLTSMFRQGLSCAEVEAACVMCRRARAMTRRTKSAATSSATAQPTTVRLRRRCSTAGCLCHLHLAAATLHHKHHWGQLEAWACMTWTGAELGPAWAAHSPCKPIAHQGGWKTSSLAHVHAPEVQLLGS